MTSPNGSGATLAWTTMSSARIADAESTKPVRPTRLRRLRASIIASSSRLVYWLPDRVVQRSTNDVAADRLPRLVCAAWHRETPRAPSTARTSRPVRHERQLAGRRESAGSVIEVQRGPSGRKRDRDRRALRTTWTRAFSSNIADTSGRDARRVRDDSVAARGVAAHEPARQWPCARRIRAGATRARCAGSPARAPRTCALSPLV